MRRVIAACLLAFLPLTAYAQAPGQELSACLADQSSGRDRKNLARWVFFSIATHPEIKQYLAPGSGQATDDANKAIGALFMRLLTEACASQAKAAVQQGGSQAIQAAFSTFGQLAMQELMSNPEVSAAMGALEKYLDQKKLSDTLVGR